MAPKPILERAYELAHSGECAGTEDIRARLKSERYGRDTERYISGPKLLSDLRKICKLSFRPTTG